jgi:hypothetical protein
MVPPDITTKIADKSRIVKWLIGYENTWFHYIFEENSKKSPASRKKPFIFNMLAFFTRQKKFSLSNLGLNSIDHSFFWQPK